MKKSGTSNTDDTIKKVLSDGPASINDICISLKISWATAKSALENLKGKGEVKEIISSKIRVFKLANDPAFYGIPLSKKQKNDAIFLFSKIREEWKKTKKEPLLATTLQKIAVDVVKESKCDIPVVPFHYGLVVPIMENPSFSYGQPETSRQIIQTIQKVIPYHDNKAFKERNNQYNKYQMRLFKAREKLRFLLNSFEKGDSLKRTQKIQLALSELFIEWPGKDKDSEFFSIYHDFLNKVYRLIGTKTFEEHIEEVKEAFDVIWDSITSHLFFQEAEKSIRKEKKEIFNCIRSSQILVKKANAEERINYLNSLIPLKENLEFEEDNSTKEIRSILFEGIEEE